jgi:hypothetical protein
MSFVIKIWTKKAALDESGSSLVEFALCLVVMLTVVFAIFDCSRALYVDHYVANVARDAARYAMVRGSTWSGISCPTTSSYGCFANNSDITSYVQSITPLGIKSQSPPLTVTASWPGTTPAGTSCGADAYAPGCVVKVEVDYAFNFILPFMPQNTLLLSSTASTAISQ